MKSKKLGIISLVCAALAFLFLVYAFIQNHNDVEKVANTTSVKPISLSSGSEELTDSGLNIKLPNSNLEVPVNSPTALSYKTKENVYDFRKKYVNNSIFSIPDYEPSEAVFGQIIDNKPWYSAEICRDKDTGLAKINGASEETRFINNPSMLVAIEFPFLWSDTDDEEFCSNPVNMLIPKKISYSKSQNEIVVRYESLPFEAKSPYFYQFNGLNARDLGYSYAYVDLAKSTYEPKFSNKTNNISTDVQQFQNFIHLGSSCGLPEGCNNGSPRQPNLEFNTSKNEGQGEIYIKLWRNRPQSTSEKPDIAERIIIEN